MKRILVLLLATSLSVFMVGCAAHDAESAKDEVPAEEQGANPEESTPQDIEITESAYYVDEHGNVHYALHLKNPNTDFEAQSVKVVVTGKDADGNVVLADESYISFILAGADFWFGNEALADVAPETVKFDIRLRDSDWLKNDNLFETAYEISNTKAIEDELAETKFTGELTTLKTWEDVSIAQVSVVLKDASGKAVGGGSTYVEVYEVGDTVPFEIFADKPPAYETYEISAIPD